MSSAMVASSETAAMGSGVQRGVRTVRRPRASTLGGASKGPVFFLKCRWMIKKEAKKVVTGAQCSTGGHPRSEFSLNLTTDTKKVKNLGERLKKSSEILREKYKIFSRAPKNLVGPGHPTASARQWEQWIPWRNSSSIWTTRMWILLFNFGLLGLLVWPSMQLRYTQKER